MRPAALLFDLDGTLVDSAPDLAAAVNEMRAARALPALPLAQLRPHAGSGARGMLGEAFSLRPGDATYESMRDEFHDRYAARLLATTQPFEGVRPLLETLQSAGRPWGIVTNKARRFSEPLAQGLNLLPPGTVLVSGDTTPHTKPHPAPLLEAARRLGVPAAECAYVGDDHRDVLAARAAGMVAWVASWGYLGPAADVALWGADQAFASPALLLQFLELA